MGSVKAECCVGGEAIVDIVALPFSVLAAALVIVNAAAWFLLVCGQLGTKG